MNLGRRSGKAAALFMAVLLVLYLIASFILAMGFLSSSTTVGVMMGIALIVLPVLGFWALWRELQFGWRTERLIAQLAEDGQLLELPAAANGPEARQVADNAFPALQGEVLAEPESWRAWLRLSLGYDAAGDRKRARAAARRAIELAR